MKKYTVTELESCDFRSYVEGVSDRAGAGIVERYHRKTQEYNRLMDEFLSMEDEDQGLINYMFFKENPDELVSGYTKAITQYKDFMYKQIKGYKDAYDQALLEENK